MRIAGKRSTIHSSMRCGRVRMTWIRSADLLLTSMMSECAKSFERLPILLHADILRNVLYSGVWCKIRVSSAEKTQGGREE